MIAQNVREQFLADTEKMVPDQLIKLMVGNGPYCYNPIKPWKISRWLNKGKSVLSRTIAEFVEALNLAWQLKTSYRGFCIGAVRMFLALPKRYRWVGSYNPIDQPIRASDPYETSLANPEFYNKCEKSAFDAVRDIYPEINEPFSMMKKEFDKQVLEVRKSGKVDLRSSFEGSPWMYPISREPTWPLSVARHIHHKLKMEVNP